MARARNIKPGTVRNEELANLDPLFRLGFVYSWMFADCNGVIEYRPKRLKADIFPYDEIDISAWLDALTGAGFIQLFVANGRGFIKVVNFVKHQNPHKQEREAGSEWPDITTPEVVICQSVEALRKHFGSHSEVNVLIPDSPFLIPDAGATTTEKFVFVGNVVNGVKKNLGIARLSHTVENKIQLEAGIAFDNSFQVSEFVECHADLFARYSQGLKIEWVNERLPGFLQNQRKIETLPSFEQLAADREANDNAARRMHEVERVQ